MPPKRDRPPLLFITQNPTSFASQKTSDDAFAIASHITARYNRWNKTNRKSLALDETTKAILTRQPSYDNRVLSNPPDEADVKAENEESHGIKEETRIAQRRQGRDLREPPVAVRPWQSAREDFEGFVEGRLLSLASQFLDPFAKFTYSSDVTTSLYFYFKVIRPFATHLMPGWEWLDSLSQIQSSPLLAYAVATYSTVFKSGMLRGLDQPGMLIFETATSGPGVVIPPQPNKGEQSFWPIPPWLRLHTKCLAELNALLSQSSKLVDDSCYQAIVFLYRLSVLLADGETGRMHLQALRRIAALKGISDDRFDKELAVSRVNLIGSFLHHDSVYLVRRISDNDQGTPTTPMVELDRKMWRCEREWYSHRACLAGRHLAWRAESPSANLLPQSAIAIARMDPESLYLGDSDFAEMRRCYQIAIFFWHYLNSISFNTSALVIRSNLLELQNRLANMDLVTMSSICYSTLFNILMAGTNAARGQLERWWFVDKIIKLYPKLEHLDSVYQTMAEFFDPLSINFNVVEEIWDDVIRTKHASWLRDTTKSTKQAQIIRPIVHSRPTTYAPDLKKPITVIEVRNEDFILGDGRFQALGA